MLNTQVVETLDETALLLELAGEDLSEVRPYALGARVVESLEISVEMLLATARLRELEGVSEALYAAIAEIVTTGRLERLERLRVDFSEELLELLRVPGLGPATVRMLHDRYQIGTLEQLRHACEAGELTAVAGIDPAMQQELLQGVEAAGAQRQLFRVNEAMRSAQVLHGWMVQGGVAGRVEIAGSLRRHRELVANINIVAAGDQPEAIINRFAATPQMAALTARDANGAAGRLANGMPVILHVAASAEFPFVLAHFTGSRAHNAVMRQRARDRGLRLTERALFSESGLPLDCADEVALYRALGMPYLPAELRENRGEFDAPFFPRLVEPADLRGVVHCHSTWSDGKCELEDLAEAAEGLGYDYLVITDHSESSVMANGMSPQRVLEQHRAIDAMNRREGPFRIVKGIEADILSDGSLDYDDDLLGRFEVVIVSMHNPTEMTRKEATTRVVTALENRHTMILGHPTTRQLLVRPGCPLDMDKVIDAAIANGVALEINVNPGRFDLDWRLMRQARDRGAKFVLGPDAHRIQGLSNIPYGVGVARKGWLRREDLLNCQPVGEFLQCLQKR